MKRTTVHKTVRVTGELAYNDLLSLVRSELDGVPEGAEIKLTVRVPGGGDWSNEDLDVAAHPVEFEAVWVERSDL